MSIPRRRRVVSLLPFGVLAWLAAGAGCGGGDDDGEAVSHSQPVGINLKVKADDVKTPALQADKNINTETSNPYGAFVQAARAHLGGLDPARVEVKTADLRLGGNSKGLTALEQAVAGSVEVLFVMNDTNNSFKVGEVKDPKGSGPVPLMVAFDSRMLGADDYRRLVGGSFKVVLRALAAAGFAGRKDTEAEFQVTFGFVAYK
jgi:hypothetical protein